MPLKPLDTFGTENKLKVHRFTNNLQGLLLLKYYSMKCFTFWENIKTISILDIENYGFILNTCHDTAKRAETWVGFLVIFSRLRWPIEPKFSQACYFIIKLWYTVKSSSVCSLKRCTFYSVIVSGHIIEFLHKPKEFETCFIWRQCLIEISVFAKFHKQKQ